MTLFLLLLLAGAIAYAWWLHGRWREAELARQRERQEERERAAGFRHEQATRLDAILDGMIEGLVVLDADGRIARVNRAAEQMFHFSRMMVGGTLLEAIRHHEIAALAARAVGSERAIEHEVRIESPQVRIVQIRPDGSLLLNGAATSLPELESRLGAAHAKDPEMSIVIKGDPEAYYAMVVDIIDLAARLNISNVGLVTSKIGS